MGNAVELQGQPSPGKDDTEFVSDLARFAEGIADEADIRRKYRLANDVWEQLGKDDELVRSIEAEKLRRIRDGSHKREKAQQYAVKVPDVAASIAFDTSASPRHRLDAGQLLDKLSGGPEAAGVPAADRFVITINLGADTEHYNRSLRVLEPGEVDPDDRGPDVNIGAIAAITAKKPTDGGGGQPI